MGILNVKTAPKLPLKKKHLSEQLSQTFIKLEIIK